MARSAQEHRDRIARHARQGWSLARRDPEFCERARRVLEKRRGTWPELTRLWLEAMDGRGPLAAWLDSDARPDDWNHERVPLDSLLASHPFASMPTWSIQTTSRAS